MQASEKQTKPTSQKGQPAELVKAVSALPDAPLPDSDEGIAAAAAAQGIDSAQLEQQLQGEIEQETAGLLKDMIAHGDDATALDSLHLSDSASDQALAADLKAAISASQAGSEGGAVNDLQQQLEQEQTAA